MMADSKTLPVVLRDEDSRSTRIMAQLEDSLISELTEPNPSLSINHHHSSFIQRRLQQFFSPFRTPTHPPYALMILRAITDLNDGTGSTEEEISEFIRKKYEDLPLAHVKILGVQLSRLCDYGDLACTEGERYVLVVDGGGGGNGERRGQCKGSKKGKKGKKRKRRVKSCEGVEIERDEGKKIHVSELDGGSTDEPSSVGEWTQVKGEKACNKSTGRAEKQEDSENGRIGVVLKQTPSQWPGAGVIDQHPEVEKSRIQVLRSFSTSRHLM